MPLPDADALAHSQRCQAHLCDAIRAAGGWISFAKFMDLALYAPGLGYYDAGARKFGAAGDFVTAPEISSLFGACIARSIRDAILTTKGSVLELGPGSGKLAADMLLALDQEGALPEHYFLLEVSADLRQRQQERLSALPAHLFERCRWLGALPDAFDGAVVANEVLDVLPVSIVSFGAAAAERGVALEGERFVWKDRGDLPPDVAELVARTDLASGTSQACGYFTEFSPQVAALSAAVARSLRHGVALWIDYGFRRAEYYHLSRATGTLMCHYRHFAHTDPFIYPGLQDITSHVDFTLVADASVAAGTELIGYATQANYLLAAGLPDLISQFDPRDAANYLKITNQVQRLVSPAEMGEFFKVIGFAKGGATIPALATCRQLPL